MTLLELIDTYNQAVKEKISFIPLKVKRKKVTSERIRIAPGLVGKLLWEDDKGEIAVKVLTHDLKKFLNKLILEAAK